MDYRKYKSLIRMCALILIAIGLVNILLYHNAVKLTMPAQQSNRDLAHVLDSFYMRQTTSKDAVPTYDGVVEENRTRYELEARLRAASEEKVS